MLGMLSVMTALAYGDLSSSPTKKELPKESEEDKNNRLAKAEIERNKANGLTEFSYGENKLWALNKKSADKKARKKNWL